MKSHSTSPASRTSYKSKQSTATCASEEALQFHKPIDGFLMVGASFTSIDFPGATATIAFGINSAGQIVGRYAAADGSNHGFLAQPGNKGKP